MWTTRNRHFSQQFFSPEGETPGGGNPPTTPPVTPPKDDKITFTPEQQQHLNNMLAAERKDAEEKTALRLQGEATAKAKAEQEQRDRDAAAARGEFDTVRADLEAKVSSTEQERDGIASERDALQAYFDGRYTAALTELPEAILAFKPADDASVAEKTKWLATAQEQASKLTGTQAAGNRPNPPASGGKFDLNAEIAKARATGRYRA